MTPYDDIDKRVEKLKKRNLKAFNRLRLKLSTRSLSPEMVNKEVKRLYNDILGEALTVYLLSLKKRNKGYTDKDVKRWLSEFYIVTKYKFFDEWRRKRERYAESLLTVKDNEYSLNSAEALKAQKTALDLLNKQIEEYGVYVIDKAIVYEAAQADETRLKWHTQDDFKVCKICRSRNGKIYPINKLPEKPHYGCRCYYERVKQ